MTTTHDRIGAPRTVTTTQPRPAREHTFTQAMRDARTLDAIREHIDRAEHGGATVVRIEHVRALLGRRAR